MHLLVKLQKHHLFKTTLVINSTFLIQNKAFSYSKNSGKVSVTVSVSKADKSGDKSVGVKTEASASKSIENITNSSKDNALTSKTAETPSFQNKSSDQSYSYDNNNNSSDDNYDRINKFGNKINGYKFSKNYEIAKEERLFDAIKSSLKSINSP